MEPREKNETRDGIPKGKVKSSIKPVEGLSRAEKEELVQG